MKKALIGLCSILVVASLSACAMGNRREQIQQQFQFSEVDTNGDGVISQGEFESWKATLQSMCRR